MWQSPCRRMARTAPARSKQWRMPAMAWPATPAQTSRNSNGMKSWASSQSRGSSPKLAMSSAGRWRKGSRPPTAWMRPRKRPSHSQYARLVELRRPPALARKDGEAEAGVVVQRRAIQSQRWHHRNFTRGEFGGKGVFFEDGVIGPALRPVELGDDPARCRLPKGTSFGASPAPSQGIPLRIISPSSMPI